MNEIVSTGSSPRRIRQNNVVAALQCLYGHGRMTRAELARQLGLNRSSSGQIVAELTESGLVRETEDDPARNETRSAGRPGIMLELVSDAALFAGLEIGVEHISVVTVDLTGKAQSHAKISFDTKSASPEAAVSQAIRLCFDGMSPDMIARFRGLGVAAPVHIRPDGRVGLAPLIGWRDLDLVAMLQEAAPLRTPIRIENDANAFAIGDSYKHRTAGVTLFMVMETGIGGGILIDGKLFRGGHGLSGEIGHMLVPGSGGISLEQLVGREALIGRYRSEAAQPQADLQDFLNGVRDREPVAVSIAEDWARHLGFTLYQACRLIDPERIVLGGSVATLYPMVAARVAAHMTTKDAIDFPKPEIAVDEDAEFGAAFGAACLLHQRFLSLENDLFAGDEIPLQRAADHSG